MPASRYFLSFIAGLTITSCGLHRANGPISANDPTPVGTIEAQGSFSSTYDISGSAAVYKADADGQMILRLNALSASTSSPLTIFLESNTGVVFQQALRTTLGNQNYSTGIYASTTWSSVVLRFGSATSATEAARAILTPP